MQYELDESRYEEIATEIAKMANKVYKTDMYTSEYIEIWICLRDYEDGLGKRIVTVAAIRNPFDFNYDVRVDIIGGHYEALNELLNMLNVMEQENSKIPIKKNTNKILN